jgi:hypothetical protein
MASTVVTSRWVVASGDASAVAFDRVPELRRQARGHTEQAHADAATMRRQRDDGSGPAEW